MFRPSVEIENIVRKKYEDYIFGQFECGLYEGSEKAGYILNAGFSFYENILSENLRKGASIDMLAYVLSEYDKYYDLSIEQKKGCLNKEEQDFWYEYGSKSKRAIKYLAEQIVNFLPNDVEPNLDQIEILSYCWIAAEEMVGLYMCSEVSYSLYPEACSVEITAKSNYNFLEFNCDELSKIIDDKKINEFIIKNEKYSEDKNIILPFQLEVQNKYLGKAFQETFNMDFAQALGVISTLIQICEPSSLKIKSVSFNKDRMVAALAKDWCELGITEIDILNIISGFTMTKEKLYDRRIFNPKQEHRALKRAFFEVSNRFGHEILFSKAMASESLSQMLVSTCFQQLPTEWLGLNKEIKKSLDSLSNHTGTWFENLLASHFDAQDIKYVKSLKKLKIDGQNYNTPNDVGEIDIIALVGNELHIIECKMVQFASEPKRYLDDVAKFTRGDKSYSSKFLRKVNWVNKNLDKVKKHLAQLGLDSSKLTIVKPIMVTYYPTIAEHLIKEHSCVDYLRYFDESL